MDSSFNYRHTQVHRADLQHRAELHRLAAQTRETRQKTRRGRPSLLAPPTLAERVQALLARLRHQPIPSSSRPS